MIHLVFLVLAVVCAVFALWGLIVVIPLWMVAAILAAQSRTGRPEPTGGGAEAGPRRLSAESRQAIRKAGDHS